MQRVATDFFLGSESTGIDESLLSGYYESIMYLTQYVSGPVHVQFQKVSMDLS